MPANLKEDSKACKSDNLLEQQLSNQEQRQLKRKFYYNKNYVVTTFLVTTMLITCVTFVILTLFIGSGKGHRIRQCGEYEFMGLNDEKPENSGAQAVVSIVKDVQTNKKYFLKSHKNPSVFKHELAIFGSLQRTFKQPDTVTPSAVCYMKRPKGVVMELAEGGDLYSNSWYHPDNSFRFQTIDQVIEAVAHFVASLASLHLSGYIHNDLRPNNVIFRGRRLQIIDFGLSREIGRVGAITRCQYNSPPENFENFPIGKGGGGGSGGRVRMIDSTSNDWYTLGVLSHFFLSKSLYCMNRNSVLEEEACRAGLQEMFWPYKSFTINPSTKEVTYEWLNPPVDLPVAFKDFIKILLCPDPKARDFSGPRLFQLLKHDLFKQINWAQINPEMYEIILKKDSTRNQK